MNIEFKWFGGGNWMIIANNFKIICDPVLCPLGSIQDYRYFKSRRIKSPRFFETDLLNVNLWLFTHGHNDHCDFGNLKPIVPESKIISDISTSKILAKMCNNKVDVLKWGEKIKINSKDGMEITVEAIPAVHGLNNRKGKLVGNGNGYWIDFSLSGNKYSIYSSGDTLPSRDTISAIRNRACDLFIANVGNATVGKGLLAKFVGRITMNLADLRTIRKHFTASTSIPIHWDAFEHYQERDIFSSCETIDMRYVNPGEIVNLIKVKTTKKEDAREEK
jgi:L-ascorbate metabolism protein UlaG (beta-lactamase superfamily)